MLKKLILAIILSTSTLLPAHAMKGAMEHETEEPKPVVSPRFPKAGPMQLIAGDFILNQKIVGRILSFITESKNMNSVSLISRSFHNWVDTLPHLKSFFHIILLDRDQTTDKDILSLAAYNTRMRTFNLSGSVKVTDEGIGHLMTKCECLKSLNLSGCTEITKFGMANIGYMGRQGKLIILNLSQNPNIDDDILIHIADNTNKLKSLRVSFCSGISLKGVDYILKNCPKLTFLDVSQCSNIADKDLTARIEAYPNVKINR